MHTDGFRLNGVQPSRCCEITSAILSSNNLFNGGLYVIIDNKEKLKETCLKILSTIHSVVVLHRKVLECLQVLWWLSLLPVYVRYRYPNKIGGYWMNMKTRSLYVSMTLARLGILYIWFKHYGDERKKTNCSLFRDTPHGCFMVW